MFVSAAVSWYAAQFTCARKGAHLVAFSDTEEESYVLKHILNNKRISFWTSLNKVDNPSGDNFRAYALGQLYVKDTGYRGSVESIGVYAFDGKSEMVDAFCVAWMYENGNLIGMTEHSCANVPSNVEGYVCEYEIPSQEN